MSGFTIKDSGARAEFDGGMVRDTEAGKIDWTNLFFGPMARRLAAHLTRGREKYPDPEPGIPNWTLGQGIDVWLRARRSFLRHQDAWLCGMQDEDHAAAMEFNINLKEYIEERLTEDELAQVRKIEQAHANAIGFGDEPQADDRCMGPDGEGCMIPHDCDGKCPWAPWSQVEDSSDIVVTGTIVRGPCTGETECVGCQCIGVPRGSADGWCRGSTFRQYRDRDAPDYIVTVEFQEDGRFTIHYPDGDGEATYSNRAVLDSYEPVGPPAPEDKLPLFNGWPAP